MEGYRELLGVSSYPIFLSCQTHMHNLCQPCSPEDPLEQGRTT